MKNMEEQDSTAQAEKKLKETLEHNKNTASENFYHGVHLLLVDKDGQSIGKAGMLYEDIINLSTLHKWSSEEVIGMLFSVLKTSTKEKLEENSNKDVED